MATLGTAAIAGYAVAGNLVTYLYLPGNALGAAMMTIVGQCLGSGDKKSAKKYAGILVFYNYMMLIVLSGAMVIFSRQLIGLYGLEGASAGYAVGLLVSHSLAMVIWPPAFLTPYYFRASGKSVFTMAVAIGTMWICRVGLAYVFIYVMHKDVLWIWYAMYIDWIVRDVLFMSEFKKEE